MSEFFEPSIQSTVDLIEENFAGILSRDTVRSSGPSWFVGLKIRL